MTYDPYAAQERQESAADALLERLNLPEGWHARVTSGVRTLALHDSTAADKLAQAIQELGDSYMARGEAIRSLTPGAET